MIGVRQTWFRSTRQPSVLPAGHRPNRRCPDFRLPALVRRSGGGFDAFARLAAVRRSLRRSSSPWLCVPPVSRTGAIKRADDFPPYIVILVLGHVVVTGMATLEANFHPPMWVISYFGYRLCCCLGLDFCSRSKVP
jgi:hypothetical protein